MKISVKVKTNSKVVGVEKMDGSSYLVRVNVPPIDGKANKAVVEALADFLNIPKSKIEIVSGLSSKNKIVELK